MLSFAPFILFFLLYLSISLTDLWVYVPAIAQVGFYGLWIVSGIVIFILSLMGKINITAKYILPRLAVMASATVFAIFISGDNYERLSTLAIKPRPLFDYPIPEITVTLTPPLYLGLETTHKNITHEDGINPIYEGSILDIHVKETSWKPTIKLSDGLEVAFVDQEDGSFKASVKIKNQISWSVKQGEDLLGHWSIILIDDAEPVIEKFALEDYENNKGYLAFNVDLNDNRKIMQAKIEVMDKDGIATDVYDLSVREIANFKNIFYVDLTGSMLAGSNADIKLSIEDEAGQTTTALLNEVTIPKKTYSHAIAGKLIELRGVLSQPKYDLRATARQMKALGLLGEKENLPPVYYMALRSAYWRLIDPVNDTDRDTARDLLWDIAQKVENGEIAIIENALIVSLDELILSIIQKNKVQVIREQLRTSDRLFRQYSTASMNTASPRYPLEIDIASLRKLYSYILTFSDQEKFYNAALIVDFMRKGIVQNDELIFNKGGLGNYFALSESRKMIENLINIQKTLLATSYNDQLQTQFPNKINGIKSKLKARKNNGNQIALQIKVGDAVKLLGKKISFVGSSNFLIDNATVLVEEILEGMNKSEISQVTQSQSELITVMSNLKRVLSKSVSRSSELQSIIEEINSEPVL